MIDPTKRTVTLDQVNDADLQQLNMIVQIFNDTDDEARAAILAYLNTRYGSPI